MTPVTGWDARPTAEPVTSEVDRHRTSRTDVLRHLPRDGWALWYVLPAASVYAVFALYPIFQTVRYSLYDWDGVTVATPVGLDNYRTAVTDPLIRQSLVHSLVFVFFYAAVPIVIGLLLTGVFSRIKIRGMTFFRAVLFIPQILASVVVAVSWRWVYAEDGPINNILRTVGLGHFARAWLGDFTFALPAIGLIGSWVMFGFCLVLFLAGVQRIPQDLYDAARVDGCGPIREFFTVTLPELRGEIRVALIFTVTFALRNFDIVWNTTSGGPGEATSVPSVYVFQGAFLTRHVGQAAAISVLLTVLILVVVGVIVTAVSTSDA